MAFKGHLFLQSWNTNRVLTLVKILFNTRADVSGYGFTRIKSSQVKSSQGIYLRNSRFAKPISLQMNLPTSCQASARSSRPRNETSFEPQAERPWKSGTLLGCSCCSLQVESGWITASAVALMCITVMYHFVSRCETTEVMIIARDNNGPFCLNVINTHRAIIIIECTPWSKTTVWLEVHWYWNYEVYKEVRG